MDFLEIISKFEKSILVDLGFELLEQHYVPYSFGSGFSVYRIKGENFKLEYDGKDSILSAFISEKHEKYPNATWENIFQGNGDEFFESRLIEIINKAINYSHGV